MTPSFKKSLHMRLTKLQKVSHYGPHSGLDQAALTSKRQGRTDPQSKSVLRERQFKAKPEFLSSTKSRARNLLDSMKVSQRVTKVNEKGSKFVQTDAKAIERAGDVLEGIDQ